jgi:hypothetical protein
MREILKILRKNLSNNINSKALFYFLNYIKLSFIFHKYYVIKTKNS